MAVDLGFQGLGFRFYGLGFRDSRAKYFSLGFPVKLYRNSGA